MLDVWTFTTSLPKKWGKCKIKNSNCEHPKALKKKIGKEIKSLEIIEKSIRQIRTIAISLCNFVEILFYVVGVLPQVLRDSSCFFKAEKTLQASCQSFLPFSITRRFTKWNAFSLSAWNSVGNSEITDIISTCINPGRRLAYNFKLIKQLFFDR